MQTANSLACQDYVVTYKGLLSRDTTTQLMLWLPTLPESQNPWDGWCVGESATGHDTNAVTAHRTCHYTMINENRAPNWEAIRMGLTHIWETYPFYHQSHTLTGVQIMRYQPGHKFREHTDHYSGAPRTLSIIIQLNDQYEGGRLSFWQGRYAPPMTEPGDAVVFPSALCFPHQVEPITKGTRYSLVVWTQ